jgi:dihydroxyacid dehydratase/phosphogluconate dehydratase
MDLDNFRPSEFLTQRSFRNAAALCMALGGSTNAIIHLTAIAGRLNIRMYPDVFIETGALVPCIVDVQPAGKKLIDEFDEAGGVPATLVTLGNLIDTEATTYTGKKLKQLLENAQAKDESIIRSIAQPVAPVPTIAILSGNIAPKGAVMKVATASPQLLQHTGKAVVFENYEEMLLQIDDESLVVDESSVLVLKHTGPRAVPGMPEWGMIPIPKKLRAKGVTDMVRISDARMSGTSFGTVILHVTPEAAAGGLFALVKTGDIISLDVLAGKISVNISDAEMIARQKKWSPPPNPHRRGYPLLYIREVLQADEGCDLEFLRPKSPEDLHFIEPIVGRS